MAVVSKPASFTFHSFFAPFMNQMAVPGHDHAPITTVPLIVFWLEGFRLFVCSRSLWLRFFLDNQTAVSVASKAFAVQE